VQVAVAPALEGCAYRQLFHHFVLDRRMLPLGLFRAVSQRGQRFSCATTNPPADTPLVAADQLGKRLELTALGGKKMTLPLPNIQMKDIGKDSGGASPTEVISETFDAISKAVVDAVASGGAIAGDALKDVGGAASDAAKGATDAAKGAADSIKKGIGGLLGK
jgi:hypothetical protein